MHSGARGRAPSGHHPHTATDVVAELELGNVNICRSADQGRHLRAAADLPVGTALVPQQPYAHAVLDGRTDLVCAWSLRQHDHLQRCSRCKLYMYATPEAQKQDWKFNAHKEECAAIVAAGDPGSTVRLAAKLIWRSMKSAASQQPGCTWQDVLGLQPHFQDMIPTVQYNHREQGRQVWQFMCSTTAEPLLPSIKECTYLVARCTINMHTISDDANFSCAPAIGLYPLGSLVNHGCQANASPVFNGRHLEFRVLRPIKKGEEVVATYVDGAMTRAERRICLSDRYFFDVCGQAGSASKQMHPDTATAEPLSPYGADAGILLTMHEQCPWAEDPVDVTAGHAVEDSQGQRVGGCGVSAFFAHRRPDETKVLGQSPEYKILTDDWQTTQVPLSEAVIFVDTWGPQLQDPQRAKQLASRLGQFMRLLAKAQACLSKGSQSSTPGAATRWVEGIRMAERALKELQQCQGQELKPAWSHIWCMRSHAWLKELHSDVEAFAEAQQHAVLYTTVAEQYFPENHPAVAQMYANRVKLELVLDLWQPAFDSATKVLQYLPATSPRSSLIQDMQFVRHTAKQHGAKPRKLTGKAC